MPNLSEILIYTGETPLSLIIWSLFTGTSLAMIVSFIVKVKFGAFMQALLKMNASSPESAVTLESTGLKRSFFVKMGLRSRVNYKNLMVAMTSDGKFYANDIYTDTPPVFKDFVFKRRIRKKSRIKASEKPEVEDEAPIAESAVAMRLRLEKERAEQKKRQENELPELTKDEQFAEFVKNTKELPKQRVKFDIKQAKFYIPEELHDRAASIYKSKPTLLIHVILGIIALALVAIAAEPIINLISESMSNFLSNFGKK